MLLLKKCRLALKAPVFILSNNAINFFVFSWPISISLSKLLLFPVYFINIIIIHAEIR